MADADDAPSDEKPLNECIVDLVVYVPAGIALSLAEELPKLAARGRDRLGVQVSSARAVGHFAVKVGANELKRRSAGLFGSRPSPVAMRTQPTGVAQREHRTGGAGRVSVATTGRATATGRPQAGNGHIPEVSTLSIPGFDSLSASQVVQRLDGLNRTELVSVRAYEASTRGRRTILNRVDQLLDERS